MEVNSTNTIDESFDFPEPSVPVEVSWNRMNILLDQELSKKIISRPEFFPFTKLLGISSFALLVAILFFLLNREHFQNYLNNKYSKIDRSRFKMNQNKESVSMNHLSNGETNVDTSLHQKNTIRNKSEKLDTSLVGESILNKKGFLVILNMPHKNIFKHKNKVGIQNVENDNGGYPLPKISKNKLIAEIGEHSLNIIEKKLGYNLNRKHGKIKMNNLRVNKWGNSKKNASRNTEEFLFKGLVSKNIGTGLQDSDGNQINKLNRHQNELSSEFSVPILNTEWKGTLLNFLPLGIDSSKYTYRDLSFNSVKEKNKNKNGSPFNKSNALHLGLQIKASLSGDKYNFKNIHGSSGPINLLMPQIIMGYGIGRSGVLSLIINAGEQTLGKSHLLLTQIKTDTFPVHYNITNNILLLKTQGIGITVSYHHMLFNKVGWSLGINNIFQQKALIESRKDSSGQLVLDSSFTINKNKFKEHNLFNNIVSINPGVNYSFGKFMIGTQLRIPLTPFSSKNSTSSKPLQGELYIRYYFK